MKCTIYLRKSVDRDRDDRSVSIESQKAEILAWAEKHGAEILEDWILDDRDYSGSTANRPGFQRLLEAARSGKAPFDAILVYDMDRFFRNHRKQQRYLDEFEDDHGIRLVSVTECDDPALLRNVKGVINEEFRQTIIKHTRKAMEDIARRGLSCGGTAPYGYRAVRLEGAGRPTRWEIDGEKAPIVLRIFEEYARGGSDSRVVRMLNADRIPHPGASRRARRNGKEWTISAVRAILMNPAYIGIRVYGRTKKVSRKPTRQIRRPPEEWISVKGAHEAIIEPGLWTAVQELRRERAKWQAQGAGTRQRYTPSGYMFCETCGGNLSIGNMNRGHKYYICRRSKEGACTNRSTFRLDRVEAWIMHLIP